MNRRDGTPQRRRAEHPLRVRFDRKFIPEPMSGCWLWIGAVARGGYGIIAPGEARSMIRATHAALLVYRETAVPKGLFAIHSCDNPACVNPDHLRVGSAQDNCDDIARRNRRPRSRKGLPYGVAFNFGRYNAQVTSRGEFFYLGTFDTPEEASRVALDFKNARLAGGSSAA